MVQKKTGNRGKRDGRPRPFRAEYVFEQGTVSVTMHDSDPSPQVVVALLKSALAKAQTQARKSSEARDVA
jgi:hypothetical protein